MKTQNSYVTYLNSLNNMDPYSDGALAEHQAMDPHFSKIQVTHPLAEKILTQLKSYNPEKPQHIILTGHAGDGKSTIVLQLYKVMKGIDPQEPLSKGIKRREELDFQGIAITLIKDLSEWNEQDQNQIFQEMIEGARCFLLISNTGCLLDLFKRHSSKHGLKSKTEIENDLLTALREKDPKPLDWTQKCTWTIYNLALHNNLPLAIDLWDKMSCAKEWSACDSCPNKGICPIYKNIQLIQKHSQIIKERIEILLRRMYEYGIHFTMRQISAHFSYMLCSGYTCEQLAKLPEKDRSRPEKFMFFNRFFGDNGYEIDDRASQLKMISYIREQGFETLLSPGFERELWFSSYWNLAIPELDTICLRIHRLIGRDSSANNNENEDLALRQYWARKQIRRMFFFLHTPEEDNKKNTFSKFQTCFVNSPRLLEYLLWQKDTIAFKRKQSTLMTQILYVLQEQFSGLHFPESKAPSQLYITLSRRCQDIRQTAQIVLGSLEFGKEFKLEIDDNLEEKTIQLRGKKRYLEIQMQLPLPFLDYLAIRSAGGMGQILQLSYIDRLEAFKNQILNQNKPDEDELYLVKQNEDFDLQECKLSINDDCLEVNYV